MSKFKELEIVISSKDDKKPFRKAIGRWWRLVIKPFIQSLTPWPPLPPIVGIDLGKGGDVTKTAVWMEKDGKEQMVEVDPEVAKYLESLPDDERIHHCGTCGGRLDE